jgi:CheY-like chemotaxis protein
MTDVLIADDDQAIRKTLILLLRELGYSSFPEADDAASTITLLRERPSRCLVLLDLLMPGIAPWPSMYHLLLTEPALTIRHVYILMAASQHLMDDLQPLFVPMLVKPFSIMDVERVIRRVQAEAL